MREDPGASAAVPERERLMRTRRQPRLHGGGAVLGAGRTLRRGLCVISRSPHPKPGRWRQHVFVGAESEASYPPSLLMKDEGGSPL